MSTIAPKAMKTAEQEITKRITTHVHIQLIEDSMRSIVVNSRLSQVFCPGGS